MRKRSVKWMSFALCAVMTVEMLFGNGMLANAEELSYEGDYPYVETSIESSEEEEESIAEEVEESVSEETEESIPEEVEELITEPSEEVVGEEPIPLTGVSLYPHTYVMTMGDFTSPGLYMFASVMPSNATDKTLTWKWVLGNSDMSMAEVANYTQTIEEINTAQMNGPYLYVCSKDAVIQNGLSVFAYTKTYDNNGNEIYVGDKCLITAEAELADAPLPTELDIICGNLHPTLGTIPLDNDWEWVVPSTPLTLRGSTGTYPIEYKGSAYKKCQKSLKLKTCWSSTPSFTDCISAKCDETGKAVFQDIGLQELRYTNDDAVPKSYYRIKYKVSKNAIIDAVKYDDGEYVTQPSEYSITKIAEKISIKTKKSGSFTVTATVEFYVIEKGKEKITDTMSVTRKFTAIDSAFSKVTIGNEVPFNCEIKKMAVEEGAFDRFSVEYLKSKKQTFVIKAYDDAPVDYESGVVNPAFTINSSNSKVAAVGKVTTAEGVSSATVTIKGCGNVFLTAIGNDSEKSTRIIRLTVWDGTITVGPQKASLDTTRSEYYYGAKYEITCSDDVEIGCDDKKDVEITDTTLDEYFLAEIVQPAEAKPYVLVRLKQSDKMESITDNPYFKSSISVKVPIKINYEAFSEARETDVTIILKGKPVTPKVTTKIEKINLFYTTSKAKIVLTSSTGMELNFYEYELQDCDYTLCTNYALEDHEVCYLSYICKEDTEGKDKSGTLVITDSNSGDSWETKVTINAGSVAPKVKTDKKSIALFSAFGQTTGDSTIVNTDGTPYNLANEAEIQQTVGADLFTVSRKSGDIIEFKVSPKNTTGKSGTVKFTVKEDNWRKPVTLSMKMTITSKMPELKCNVPAIILNCNELYAAKECMNFDFYVDDVNVENIQISAANATSKAILGDSLIIEKSYREGFHAYFNGKVKPGTYKFKATANAFMSESAKQEVSTIFSVKVINNAKGVTIKTSGFINLYDRKNSKITVTPTFNLSNSKGPIRFSGPDKDMFSIKTPNMNSDTVLIYATTENEYYLNKVYHVVIEYDLWSDHGCRTVKADVLFKVKAPAKKTKAETVAMKMDAYEKAESYIDIKNTGSMQPSSYEVKMSSKNDGLFVLDEYQAQNQDLRVHIAATDVSKLKQGKTYTVTLEIWDMFNPLDGKPIIVKVPIRYVG